MKLKQKVSKKELLQKKLEQIKRKQKIIKSKMK